MHRPLAWPQLLAVDVRHVANVRPRRTPDRRGVRSRRCCGRPGGARGARRSTSSRVTAAALQVSQDGPTGQRIVGVPSHGGQCTGGPLPRPRSRRTRPVAGQQSRRARIRCDSNPRYTLARYIEAIYRAVNGSSDRARPRHPRTPQGTAAPRLRAAQAPRRGARLAVGHLVRVALPGAAAARTRRRHRDRRRPGLTVRADPRHRLARRRPRGGPAAPGARSRAGARARHTASPNAATPGSRSCCSPTTAGDDERTFALKLVLCRHLAPAARLEPPRAPPRRPRRRPRARPPVRAARRSVRALAVRAPHAVHPTRSRMDRGTHRRQKGATTLPTKPNRPTPKAKEPPHHEWSNPCRHRRRRELREQPRAGRRVLPQRRSRRRRARA